MNETEVGVQQVSARRSLGLRLLFALVVVGTLFKAVVDSRSGLEVIDLWFLSETGAALFGEGWANVFSDPAVQVGPLLLLIQGILWELAAFTGLRLELLFSVLVQVSAVLAFMTMIVVGPRRGSPKRWGAALLGGALLSLWELPWNAYVFGHPSEFFIPVLWLMAARLARDGRSELGGVLIGLSAALKAWGLLGVPLIFLGPRSTWARGLLSASAVSLAIYGPFFLFGEVATLKYEWIVGEGTGASLFLPVGEGFGWPFRFGQGMLSVGVGVVVAMWVRGKDHALVWTPALAVIAARLAVDPTAFSYYWLAPQVILLVGAGWTLARHRVALPLLLVGVAVTSFLIPVLPVLVVALLMLLAAVVTPSLQSRISR